jgi:hypothetical protein
MAWLFHQMRFGGGFPPPPPEEVAKCAPGGPAHDPDGSFFAKVRVQRGRGMYRRDRTPGLRLAHPQSTSSSR